MQRDINLQIENILEIIPIQADSRSINILNKELTLILPGQLRKINIGIKIYLPKNTRLILKINHILALFIKIREKTA